MLFRLWGDSIIKLGWFKIFYQKDFKEIFLILLKQPNPNVHPPQKIPESYQVHTKFSVLRVWCWRKLLRWTKLSCCIRILDVDILQRNSLSYASTRKSEFLHSFPSPNSFATQGLLPCQKMHRSKEENRNLLEEQALHCLYWSLWYRPGVMCPLSISDDHFYPLLLFDMTNTTKF